MVTMLHSSLLSGGARLKARPRPVWLAPSRSPLGGPIQAPWAATSPLLGAEASRGPLGEPFATKGQTYPASGKSI